MQAGKLCLPNDNFFILIIIRYDDTQMKPFYGIIQYVDEEMPTKKQCQHLIAFTKIMVYLHF